MTFSELVQLVRDEIIVDQYGDAFSDAAILDVLWRASVETAAAFDIPRELAHLSVAAGTSSLSLPFTPRKVHTVLVNGDDLRSADPQELLRMASGSNRVPRYFNYDPRRSQALLLAPIPATDGTLTIEYTAALVRPVNLGAAQAWGGVLPEFHSLIVYRAATSLYQMEERQEETAFWVSEYQNRSSELAAFLGRTDIPNLIVPSEARDDKGPRE